MSQHFQRSYAMSNWSERDTGKEKDFKQRYNRDTEVRQETKVGANQTIIQILHSDDEYILHEYRREGLTDFVIVKINGKEYKYNVYLDAEVFVADTIGEKIG